MRKYILIVIVLLAGACKKFRDLKDDSDVKGTDRIRGRLFLFDNLTSDNSARPLGGKRVTIGYADLPDSLNFLYEQPATADGYFDFKHLMAGTRYRLNYSEEINGILYSGTVFAKAPQDTISMVVTVDRSNQNGFHIVVEDSLSGTIRGMEVCVFNSRFLFDSKSCAVSTFKINTDTLGRIFRFKIPEDKYYFRGNIIINNTEYEIADSITVGDRVEMDTFRLFRQPVVNGIHYTVLDAFGGRVPNVSICVFSSLELYRRDTCEGHNFRISVGVDGTGELRNVTAGTYYVFMKQVFGGLSYYARDTIMIDKRLVSDTLWLRK